jgi:predicted amidohydrolase YtcJ
MWDALGAHPHRKLLDAIIPDVPVFIDSMDLHSCWTNTKGLEVLGITRDTPDPKGGEIERDEAGEPTGVLLETAFHDFVWPYIGENTTLDEAVGMVEAALDAFVSTGVTGAVDMAMSEDSLAALEVVYAKRGRNLPLRLNMHWLITPKGTDEDRAERVQTAANHKARLADKAPFLNLVGIKIISDGVVDSCTAYMKEPYPNGATPEPIWQKDELTKVLVLADSLGLQIACHALGDAASEQAMDAFDAVVNTNGPRHRRNRIEHLEVCTHETVHRMAEAGITASLQPLHADPVYARNWHAQVDATRSSRAFPFAEFRDAGANVAFGTDAPVAPHHALPNVYSAATRKSIIDPTLDTPETFAHHNLERFCIPLEQSIRYYTMGTAVSMDKEGVYGSLEAGKKADFCILSVDPFRDGVDTLRRAQEGVTETWLDGERVWTKAA